jgi:hypothetical protein
MGHHSSPITGFLMTLFNARLGAWLGNPAVAGDYWKHAGPRSAISIVKEALGLTDNRSKYVYLSDGGHFENLGLYEMVLRRCRFIVVLDCGCDPKFKYADLGNAIRKIRIDLRIPIEFIEESAGRMRANKKRAAVATIKYSAVDPQCVDGKLIYIKPMWRGNEAADVQAYRAANPTFPHQSTSNQWFTESQTESYRMLGYHTVDEICGGWQDGSIEALSDHIERQYLGLNTHTPRSATNVG